MTDLCTVLIFVRTSVCKKLIFRNVLIGLIIKKIKKIIYTFHYEYSCCITMPCILFFNYSFFILENYVASRSNRYCYYTKSAFTGLVCSRLVSLVRHQYLSRLVVMTFSGLKRVSCHCTRNKQVRNKMRASKIDSLSRTLTNL